jgi:hypothetical protein
VTDQPTARQRLLDAMRNRTCFCGADSCQDPEPLVDALLAEHAHQLAEQQREDIDLTTHSGESIYLCEDCAVVRAAASIDPEVQP